MKKCFRNTVASSTIPLGFRKKQATYSQKGNVEDKELKDTESQKLGRGFGKVRKEGLGAKGREMRTKD